MKKLKLVGIFLLLTLVVFLILSQTNKQGELNKITLRLNWTPSAEHAFIYLGIDKGFYKEKGIDLQVLPSEGSTIVAQLIGNKNNDFGLISGDTLVMSKIKGVPITALATLYHSSPAVIYSLKEKNITEPRDLEGKKLGVLIKSTTFQQYQGMLNSAGVDRSKITEVPVSGNVQELLSGSVDAAMHYTNYLPIQIRELGYNINEIFMKDYGINIYSQTLITNGDYIKNKSDLVQRFVDASLKSLEYTKTHPEEAIDSLLKYHPELDRKLQMAMLKRTNELIFDTDAQKNGAGYMTQEGWQETEDTLFKVGLIDRKIAPTNFFDDTFWRSYNKASTNR